MNKADIEDTTLERQLAAQVIASEKRAEAAKARAEEFPEEKVRWEEVPSTQHAASQMQYSEEEEEEDGPDQDEEEEEDDLPSGPPFNPQIWPPVGGKRPRGYVPTDEEIDQEIIQHNREYKRGFAKALICEEEVGDRGPDLQAYFAQWPEMSTFSQIAMCRTFANYKAQEMRALKPKVEKKARVINYGKTQ